MPSYPNIKLFYLLYDQSLEHFSLFHACQLCWLGTIAHNSILLMLCSVWIREYFINSNSTYVLHVLVGICDKHPSGYNR